MIGYNVSGLVETDYGNVIVRLFTLLIYSVLLIISCSIIEHLVSEYYLYLLTISFNTALLSFYNNN